MIYIPNWLLACFVALKLIYNNPRLNEYYRRLDFLLLYSRSKVIANVFRQMADARVPILRQGQKRKYGSMKQHEFWRTIKTIENYLDF